MKKTIWDKYNSEINQVKINSAKDIAVFQEKINFLRHERLVHLIVTIFFSITTLFWFWCVVNINNEFIALLFIIFLVITSFYLAHYYKLENMCQSWQKLYIDLLNKSNKKTDRR